MIKRITGWLLLLTTLAVMVFAVLHRGNYSSFFAEEPLFQRLEQLIPGGGQQQHPQPQPDPDPQPEHDAAPLTSASSHS